MAESALLQSVRLEICRIPGVLARIFRNNIGMGWVGKSRKMRPGETYKARGGEVIVFDARPLHAGLIKGSGDGIGWNSVVITQDMVGQRVAVFLSIETKVPNTGRLETEQKTWHTQVQAAGGISIIARSTDDLQVLARSPPPVDSC